MGAALANEGLVVRLEGGRSGRRELHLEGGRPHLPFAVGEQGDWKVSASRPDAHVMIAYNGSQVFVAAVGMTEGIEVNGLAAEPKWVAPALPVVVSFGEARLVIDEDSPIYDVDEVTASSPLPSAHFIRSEAMTELADDARLQEALEISRQALKAEALAMAPTSKMPPLKRRLTPPPLPSRRPMIRPITRAWDRS